MPRKASWYATTLANSPHVNPCMTAHDFSAVYVHKIPRTTNDVLKNLMMKTKQKKQIRCNKQKLGLFVGQESDLINEVLKPSFPYETNPGTVTALRHVIQTGFLGDLTHSTLWQMSDRE